MSPAEVTTPSDTEVRVVRTFDAPARLVWRAYTEPALMQQWLSGMPGWSMPVCEMDVRVGGAFRWRWRSDADGKEFGFYGEFKELTPHERIVHSEFYDSGDVGGDMGEGMLVTVTLEEAGGGTTVVTRLQFNSKAERDAALSTGMSNGMEVSYQKLDVVLAAEAA